METKQTTFTLSYWLGRGTKTYLGGLDSNAPERVYVTDADGNSFYFQRSQRTEADHKGYVGRQYDVEVVGADDATAEAVLTAIGVERHKSVDGETLPWHFAFVADHARGYGRVAGVFGTTPKKEAAKLRKARDERVFTLSMAIA